MFSPTSVGNKDEKNAAKAILPLRKKGNFLLCTLVIANTLSESLLNYMASFLGNKTPVY